MARSESSAPEEAAKLLLSCHDGVLSTLSVTMAGYPFGSVVPFCVDRLGNPIILIADIAQHTKNIRHSPKVSLIVFDRSADDLQANGRLTIIADAALVADDEADTHERYYRYFPSSRDYHLTHGFQFWRLMARRLRYIGGFGAIHWLEPSVLPLENPFSTEQEVDMVEHMNADHVNAMRGYISAAGLECAVDTAPRFAGCDRFGFHLINGARVIRIAFPEPVDTPQDVRTALVALAHRK